MAAAAVQGRVLDSPAVMSVYQYLVVILCCLINIAAFTTAANLTSTSPYAVPSIFGETAGIGSPCIGVGGTGASGVVMFGHHDGAWKTANTAITL